MAGIREVTKADVKRVASKYLHPDKFALIAVGKSSDFDKPLNSLGDVTEVDIAIPPPSPELVPEAGEEAVTRGKEILAYVIEAHGGLDKLKRVNNIVTKRRMVVNTPGGMMELDGEATIVFPTKARFDMVIPAMGMQMSRVYDGQSAWLVMSQGVQPLPAAFVEEAKKEIFRDSIPLLTYISDKGVSVQYLGAEDVKGKMTDVILVSNTPADSLKLFIDQETKHIVKKKYQALTEQGPAEREEFLDDYREVSGVMVAFHTVLVDNGEKSAEITFSEVMLNTEVDESLFEK
jgi:outer membrane lipoprotein-sorting protein